MALYISLKRKNENIDFNRFSSAFNILHDLFININLKKSNIVFYLHEPLQELNKDFKRINFYFGLLESDFRSRLEKLGREAIYSGFELESNVILKDKSFRLIFILLPRNKSLYYDIKIEILSNGYADIFEDLENFYPSLRNYLFERILFYNNRAESNKKPDLFLIKRADLVYNTIIYRSIENEFLLQLFSYLFLSFLAW